MEKLVRFDKEEVISILLKCASCGTKLEFSSIEEAETITGEKSFYIYFRVFQLKKWKK